MQESNAEPLFTTIDYIALPVVAVFFVIAIWGWVRAIRNLLAGQPMIPLDRPTTPIGFIDVAVLFGIWAASQLLIAASMLAMAGPAALQDAEKLTKDHGIELLLLSGIGQLCVLILGIAYLMFRYRSAGSFGFRFANLGQQIKTGAFAFIMIFPIIMTVQFVLSKLVPYEHAILDVLAQDPTPLSIASTWLAAVIAAPLAEELFFRGALHNWLERVSISSMAESALFTGGRSLLTPTAQPNEASAEGQSPKETTRPESVELAATGDNKNADLNPFASPNHSPPLPELAATGANVAPAYWPIIVSSLFFALVHVGQGLAPVPLFILAVGLGYVFRQTGSFIACWTMHFMLNCYSMLIFTIALLMGETP